MNRAQRSARETADARTRLVALLQETVGPALTGAAAQSFLEEAKAWGPVQARELDQHVTEHPNALTAPSPFSPKPLARLLRLLDAAGHGDAVNLLACARCGRTDREFPRTAPEGRCCAWCLGRDEKKTCARCNELGHIVTEREEGQICRRCYRVDAKFHQDCGRCGHRRAPNVRLEDGTALCVSCAPKPERECARCGQTRRVAANLEEGPVCKSCYDYPVRLCGRCKRVGVIGVRGRDGLPDICTNCYHAVFPAECTVCGRVRGGYKVGGNAFHCYTCAPRTTRTCGSCGDQAIPQTTWPLGPVCGSCYSRRRRYPGPCAACGNTAVLVGRSSERLDICGPCAGADGLEYRCRRCDSAGEPHSVGRCIRCVVEDRVRGLLGDEAGNIPSSFQPLADALIGARNPWSVRVWIDQKPSAKLLAKLTTDRTELTHEHLDALPQDRIVRHIRAVLVTTGLLPRRQEPFAQLELWMKRTLVDLPPHQQPIIRPFAEWHVVRDARRRAARDRYTHGSAAADRRDIRGAVGFLTWIEQQDLDLASVTQADLDRWVTDHPTKRRALHSFIRWAVARRLTGKLKLDRRQDSLPANFLPEDEFLEQLKRCLNDDSIPLPARIAGALTRLFGLSTIRIVGLTVDRFHRDGDDAYLTVGHNPVLLPPKLARLIEQQINGRGSSSVFDQAADRQRFLLPGRPASKPLHPGSLQRFMRKHGLPIITARNTAMLEAVSDLPPTVVSDLFGIHPGTAYRWAQYAENGWADYLAVCQDGKE